MALQALAKYATTAYVRSEEVNLAVKSAQNFQHTFNVQAANRLVFQQEMLPHIPGVYTLEASGQGCVYAQVSRALGFPGASVVNYPPEMQETWVQSLGWEDPQKGMATHLTILAWKISQTGKPGGRQSMGSQSQAHLSD